MKENLLEEIKEQRKNEKLWAFLKGGISATLIMTGTLLTLYGI